ncbi:MAG: HAD hydrolase family protein [Hamadaea sp.]|nr:HAD hydrolase family protein [Hamadaea sp.]
MDRAGDRPRPAGPRPGRPRLRRSAAVAGPGGAATQHRVVRRPRGRRRDRPRSGRRPARRDPVRRRSRRRRSRVRTGVGAAVRRRGRLDRARPRARACGVRGTAAGARAAPGAVPAPDAARTGLQLRAPAGVPGECGSAAGRGPGGDRVSRNFTVVATDLDGTLLRSDLTVSARTRRALAAAQAHGARHLVVTGRQATGCRTLLTSFGYRGVAVCGQGAQVYDVDDGRLLWSTTFDRDVAAAAVALITAEVGAMSLGVATAGADGRVLLPPGFYSRPGADCEVVDPARLWAAPIEKVFLRHRALPAATLAGHVARVCGDAVTVTYSHHSVVEILPAGITKAAGLAIAADLLGFTADQTIAFGDMPNDLPMFAWAGHGVAMGNGDPSLHAVADEIAPGNDDDGVATVLERLYPGLSASPTGLAAAVPKG